MTLETATVMVSNSIVTICIWSIGVCGNILYSEKTIQEIFMRRSGWTKWLIVIPAMLGIVLVTYVRYTTDIWGFGAFICQLIAIFGIGLWSANCDAGTE